MEIRAWEVVPKSTTRTECGRVVINPPTVMGALGLRETGRFRMCCNRAFLTDECFQRHQQEVTEHGKPLAFNGLQKAGALVPAPLEKMTSSPGKDNCLDLGTSGKKGVADQVPEVNPDSDPTPNSKVQDQGGLPGVSVKDENRTEKGRLWKECTICSQRTNAMSRHMRTCHTSGSSKCRYCPCTFRSEISRSLHQGRIHTALPSTSRRQNLVARAIGRTKSSKNAGRRCGRKSKVEVSRKPMTGNLKSHPGKGAHHSSASSYSCDLCKRGYSNSQALRLHRWIVHLTGFVSKPNGTGSKQLDTGLFIDAGAGSTPHMKSIFGVKFGNEDSAEKIDKPKGKTTKCTLCSLQIHSKLSQHMRNCHSPDGTFQCSSCTCKLKTLRGLNRHLRQYHEDKNKLLPLGMKTKSRKASSAELTTCLVCGGTFSRKNVLINHMKVAHSDGPYKCKYCNSCFHHPIGLTKHVTWHETGRTSGKRQSGQESSGIVKTPRGIAKFHL